MATTGRRQARPFDGLIDDHVNADVPDQQHAPRRVNGVHFDTADIPVDVREEVIHDVIAHGQTPLEIQDLQNRREGISLQIDAADLGPLSVQSMRITPTAATRGPRLARDDSEPCVFLIVKKKGSSTLIQEGREGVFGPGDLILLSSSHPSVVVSEQHDQRQVVRIPTAHLAVPDQALRHALAVPVNSETPLAGVLARFVDGLTSLQDIRRPEAEHLARATVDLVRGFVSTAVGDERRAQQAQDATLQLHVIDYLQRHWHEHDLTADRLAAVHHISTRQLYRLLAAEGISLSDWLRERRLVACRDELSRASAAALSVSSVGRRWGFHDATNFGRAFKSAFGLTPAQWRLLHRA
ncbi:helix-turn-helix domain-containing protein [Micromonosporaceae bacterium Da 78-11]